MQDSQQSFISQLKEFQDSEQIDPVRLDLLVTRLREGDRSVIKEIIIGHLRLVLGIVGTKAAWKRSGDDIVGEAFLALTEAVNDAITQLYDNNITFYITTSVRWKIKTAIAADHTVRVSDRTIRDKISKGANFKDIIVWDRVAIAEDPTIDDDMGEDPCMGSSFNQRFNHSIPYHVPIAKQTEPSIEFKEALHRATQSPIEQAVIKLRSEGYGYEEIGRKVGYSKTVIGDMVPAIEKRFDAYFKK